MNLEIATRLVGLRKANKLSQEALAEKLGISRQAVSKWERAEASPDTDNLIALAKLYHVSLDELLKIHDEEESGIANGEDIVVGDGICGNAADEWASEASETDGDCAGQTERNEQENSRYSDEDAGSMEDDVHIGFRGIHVKDRNGDEVHIGWDGIHVHDKDNDVHIDKNGIIVNGEEARKHLFVYEKERAQFPLGILAIVIYIVIGIFFDLWHPGWILFFLVPVIGSLLHAVRRRNANLFAYPVFVLFVFLYVGFVHLWWHPAWALFLTIPLYYSFVGYWQDRKRGNEEEW